jgi:hypothetical protein
MSTNQVNDLRGEPTFACICGCLMFEITVMWDQESREVSWYDLAQKCTECGTITAAPTPMDWRDCE